MTAGDIVYQHNKFPKTRNELTEFLCDALEASLGPDNTDRQSNGHLADTLLRFLDLAVVTKKQKTALDKFLAED